ncbi:MBL fold metallo-hydrolase [Caldimonas manganoxidans]|jgi:glyoxylase-like metal-dependent hydrolase (beta-lactamase superfamily II)|uniref:MBL fold metallo-hydrolase n=1 Tax=Caldimonas manganoxidans TaxID=196015 RepID=UPI0003811629|nr:MBL fold metallo-hydrolase [Caldimonas manganoxidans]
MLQRRQFLAGSAVVTLGALGGLGWAPVWAQNAPDLGLPELPNPGFARLRLGEVEILAINDGVARRPLAEGFVREVPLAQVQAALRDAGLPTTHVDIGFTAFVAILGERRILMDTGNGQFGAPTTGRLLAHLQAAGLPPDQIDTVLITHFHGDHINGLRNRDGSTPFPKAEVWVPEAEWAFWMDDARMNAAPDAMRGAFQNVRRVFGPIATQVRRFAPDAVLMPGLRAIAAHGHTPGMSMFQVESRGQRFLNLADLSNLPALFVRQPDWAVTFDMDPQAARAVRHKILSMAAQEGVTVGGYHFPFPAFGQLQRQAQGYDFKPART